MTLTITLTLIAYLVLAILIALGAYIFRRIGKAEREITQDLNRMSASNTRKAPAAHPEAPSNTTDNLIEVPAHLRNDINRTLHLAELDYNLRKFSITIRAYKRLAHMFPDVMDDLLAEETARAEREEADRDD